MTAGLLLFGLTVYVAYVVRSTILKLRKVDENIDKLLTIEKAQELINNEINKLK